MSYDGPKPLLVPAGGTGESSLTAYAVLTGGTTSTSSVQSVAGLGTSGQVLTSNGAGALPTFQNTAVTGVTTIDGDSGSATGSTITFNANSNAGLTALFSAASSTVSFKVTDSNNNTTIGASAGKSGQSGTDNTGIGGLSLSGLTSGGSNTCLGYSSGATVTSGSNSIIIGKAAGSSLQGTESNNIIIGNVGPSGGSNQIAIGNQGSGTGQQNLCTIAGSTNDLSISNSASIMAVTSSQLIGQVGTYAKSTWTPQLNFGGSSAGTQNTAGYYIQIGPIIFAGFNITLTTKGSATGNATISGLPVSTGSSGNAWIGPLTGGFGAINGLGAYVRGTGSAATLDVVYNASGSYAFITNTSFANGDTLQGSIAYSTQ